MASFLQFEFVKMFIKSEFKKGLDRSTFASIVNVNEDKLSNSDESVGLFLHLKLLQESVKVMQIRRTVEQQVTTK